MIWFGVNRVFSSSRVNRWETGEKPIDKHVESLIRLHVAEELEIDLVMSVEEVTRRSGGGGPKRAPIRIDGRNPEEYHPKAA